MKNEHAQLWAGTLHEKTIQHFVKITRGNVSGRTHEARSEEHRALKSLNPNLTTVHGVKFRLLKEKDYGKEEGERRAREFISLTLAPSTGGQEKCKRENGSTLQDFSFPA